MNPYAKFLDGGKPLELIASNPERIGRILNEMTPATVDRAISAGKWSPREILCHLADCEIAFGFRLRQTLAERDHVIQPFDQDAWAANYAGLSAADAMKTYVALRSWNLAMIKSAGPKAMSRTVTHPERGTMTFQTIVETMAGHDANHIKQLEAALTPA